MIVNLSELLLATLDNIGCIQFNASIRQFFLLNVSLLMIEAGILKKNMIYLSFESIHLFR